MKLTNRLVLLLAMVLLVPQAAAPANDPNNGDGRIAAQPLGDALAELARRSGLQLIYGSEIVRGRHTRGAPAGLPPSQQLARLLEGTGLEHEFLNERTVTIRLKDDKPRKGDRASQAVLDHPMRLAEAAPSAAVPVEPSEPTADAHESKGIPEILVRGRKTLNMDIERSEDAPQPYVVFSREEIERSQADNLEDFLRTRLPMNTQINSGSQTTSTASSTRSGISMRGLGQNETLILIDGRRLPSVSLGSDAAQPDINGISMSEVERIEVLPSTAGGIYGGSATGGVINIVLRRDFTNVEADARYANTFDTDVADLRVNVRAGFNLEGGRTQVRISAGRSEANNLLVGDRDFNERSIALQLRNNPAAILNSTVPPRGATVNIRAVSGNLVLDPQYGGGPSLGSNITHIPLGYAGPASDNGAALIANAGTYNLDMPQDANGARRGLGSAPSVETLSLYLRRQFTDAVEAFIDASRRENNGRTYLGGISNVANLPANAPNNPFRQAIAVSFPTPGLTLEHRSSNIMERATAGLIFRLPQRWRGTLDYTWSRSSAERRNTAGTGIDSAGLTSLRTGQPAPDGRPALNVLQEGNTFPIDFTPYLLPSPSQFFGPYVTDRRDATLRLSGPALGLPAGKLNVTALVEWREEHLRDGFSQGLNTTTLDPTFQFLPHRSRDEKSFYLEASVPLVSSQQKKTLIHELELQASVRHDAYTTEGTATSSTQVPSREGPFPDLEYVTGRLSSTDATFAMRWAPVKDLALRASYGTGFLPPSVSQVASNFNENYTNSLGASDPKRGHAPLGQVPYLYIFGGSPHVRPEQSESRSVGLIFTPRFAPGLRFSIDFTRIDKVDEIQVPNVQFLLDNEEIFADRIERGPKLPTDEEDWPGPIVRLDRTLLNISQISLETFDFNLSYTHETAGQGEFRWRLRSTYQPHYITRALPDSPGVDHAGFDSGPLKWRGNAGVDWHKGALTLGWNAQYYGSRLLYSASATQSAIDNVILNQGSVTLPAQIYHDLIATYRFDAAPGAVSRVLANSTISLGIQNILNTSPPIHARTDPASAAAYSTLGNPRLRRYSISIRKSFK